MVTAFVGLGSNLANPLEQVERGIAALDALPQSRVVARSRCFRTPPWGGIAQPDFINAVAAVETALSARALMLALLDIERAAGRRREGPRNGPRVLDLDLLAYADATIDADGLVVPHPRLAERAFVIVPLAQIAPAFVVPGQGRVDALLAALPAAERAAVVPV